MWDSHTVRSIQPPVRSCPQSFPLRQWHWSQASASPKSTDRAKRAVAENQSRSQQAFTWEAFSSDATDMYMWWRVQKQHFVGGLERFENDSQCKGQMIFPWSSKRRHRLELDCSVPRALTRVERTGWAAAEAELAERRMETHVWGTVELTQPWSHAGWM